MITRLLIALLSVSFLSTGISSALAQEMPGGTRSGFHPLMTNSIKERVQEIASSGVRFWVSSHRDALEDAFIIKQDLESLKERARVGRGIEYRYVYMVLERLPFDDVFYHRGNELRISEEGLFIVDYDTQESLNLIDEFGSPEIIDLFIDALSDNLPDEMPSDEGFRVVPRK